MSNYIIKNGLVIDPVKQTQRKADILIKDGKIADIAAEINCSLPLIDAANCIVTPGFVELHAHFREPGFEGKETLDTGCQSALQGGYTTVCTMPNTNPAIDKEYLVRYQKLRGREINKIKLEVIGAVSKGLAGQEMAELGKMYSAGAVAFSDDGMPVMNSGLMRNALVYSSQFAVPIVVHQEDHALSGNGVMHEGPTATKLGLAGIPALAEEVMIARDIELIKNCSAKLHVAHVSTAGSVALIREAKSKGLAITCEVTPHHLTLTDSLLAERLYDTNLKMSPPLRTANDVEACINGLLDGTIDAIATDHAPHRFDEKDVEFNYAPNGITGLETAFSALYTALVKTNRIDLLTLVKKLSSDPARVFNLPGGTLNIGSWADIAVIDLNRGFKVLPEMLATKGKNTPWLYQKHYGKVCCVLVNGEIKFVEESFNGAKENL